MCAVCVRKGWLILRWALTPFWTLITEHVPMYSLVYKGLLTPAKGIAQTFPDLAASPALSKAESEYQLYGRHLREWVTQNSFIFYLHLRCFKSKKHKLSFYNCKDMRCPCDLCDMPYLFTNYVTHLENLLKKKWFVHVSHHCHNFMSFPLEAHEWKTRRYVLSLFPSIG